LCKGGEFLRLTDRQTGKTIFFVIKRKKRFLTFFLKEKKIKPVHVYKNACVLLSRSKRLKDIFLNFRCHVHEMVAHGLHTDARAREAECSVLWVHPCTASVALPQL
jgi:hypothetical protein